MLNKLFGKNVTIILANNKKLNKQIDMITFKFLMRFDCLYNSIIEFINIDKCVYLSFLDCSYNKIKNIDVLPKSLKVLICSHNSITTIDFLPSSIISINCSYNRIENYSDLPNNIKTLSMSFNKPNSIENLIKLMPKSLEDFTISSYLIDNIKIDTNQWLVVKNNFGIKRIIKKDKNISTFSPTTYESENDCIDTCNDNEVFESQDFYFF